MITKIDIDVSEIRRIAAAIKPDAEGYPASAHTVYAATADGYSVMICVLQDESLSVIIETESDAGTTGESTAAGITGER